jgi:hypothetical protein
MKRVMLVQGLGLRPKGKNDIAGEVAETIALMSRQHVEYEDFPSRKAISSSPSPKFEEIIS